MNDLRNIENKIEHLYIGFEKLWNRIEEIQKRDLITIDGLWEMVNEMNHRLNKMDEFIEKITKEKEIIWICLSNIESSLKEAKLKV
ncbi:MAG TPA: hypothetical protein VKR58_12225 [Aquella sp.]|nr:hypothetical protein [Aquella sp.]